MLDTFTFSILANSEQTVTQVGLELLTCLNKLGWSVSGAQNSYNNQANFIVCLSSLDNAVFSSTIDGYLFFDDVGETALTEASNDAVIIFDPDNSQLSSAIESSQTNLPIYVSQLSRQAGMPSLKATVALGAILAYLSVPLVKALQVVERELGVTSAEWPSVKSAFSLGYEQLKSHAHSVTIEKAATRSVSNAVMSGYQAIEYGCLTSGVKFITGPATIVDDFAQEAESTLQHVAVVPTLNNNQAIHQAIGASIAGVRAVVISNSIDQLMTGFNLASRMESPLLLIVETESDQSQIQQALALSATNTPVIMAIAATTDECFTLTQELLNLSEQYQTPVLLLLDTQLARGYFTTSDLTKFRNKIQRGQLLTPKQALSAKKFTPFNLTETGISTRKLPGQPGIPLALNLHKTADTLPVHQNIHSPIMVEKRFNKLETIAPHVLSYKLHGSADAELTLICYGVTLHAALSSQLLLKAEGIKVNVLQIIYINPLGADHIKRLLRHSRRVLVIESGHTPQLQQFIASRTGISLNHCLQKIEGTIMVEDIISSVNQQFTINPEGIL